MNPTFARNSFHGRVHKLTDGRLKLLLFGYDLQRNIAVGNNADQPIIIAIGNDRQFARLAAMCAARGELLAPEKVEPTYLRNQVALTLAQQQALRDAR